MVNSRDWEFRWNTWNIEHIGEHGVESHEAEEVIRQVRRPFPEYVGDGKWHVDGQTADGRYLRVVFIISPEETFYVIHAMDLNEREKKRYRRRRQ